MDISSFKWEITSRAHQLIIELEAIKLNFEALKLSPKHEENLRKTALLKSAVFSTRIEGFPDTMSSPKLESQNLVRAYRLINSERAPQKPSVSFIRELHSITLDKISSNAGRWRTEEWGIFNEAGVAIYKAPIFISLPGLMDEFVIYINSLTDHVGIRAAVAQFIFEKIHPFADGNGRVGRLISAHILAESGHGFRGLAPFEEYIDAYRLDYYDTLTPDRNISSFVEFFLEAVVSQSKQILTNLNEPKIELPEDDLSPRQQEILATIKDHPYSSFDFIQRRFMSIKPSTLHYDMAQLMKFGFIKKNQRTRGASYLEVKEN